MKNKHFFGFLSLVLAIPLASCGGSSNSYKEIKGEFETVYRDYGIQVNDLDNQEQSHNQRAARRNLFFEHNDMYQRVIQLPSAIEKDSNSVQDYYFEALRYSANPVLIYGELFKEKDLGDFLNKVIKDDESYFKIEKHNESTITTSYVPDSGLQLQFTLNYLDESNYSFECFQYNETNNSNLYVWGNSNQEFLFTGQEKNNTFALYTVENGTKGFSIEHIETIDPNYFDVVKLEFERLKLLNLKNMTSHVDQEFSNEEVMEMSKRLFPRIQQEQEIVYGWYDEVDFTYYATKDDEKRVSIPENYKLKKHLIILDYSQTVQELYIPKSVTMEMDKDSFIVLNYVENKHKYIEKQLSLIIIEEGSQTFLNTDFVLYNADKSIPLAVFANPNGKTLDLNVEDPGHIFIEPSMMKYVENVISCWDKQFDNLLGHIGLPIDEKVHVKSWHMNNVPNNANFKLDINYPIDKLTLSGDFEVVEILDLDGQIKQLILDSTNPNAYVKNSSVVPNYSYSKPLHFKDNDSLNTNRFNTTSEYYFDYENKTCLDLSQLPLWDIMGVVEGGIMNVYLSKSITKVIASFPTTIGPRDIRNAKNKPRKIIIHSQNDIKDGFEYIHDGDETFLLQYPNKDYLVKNYVYFDEYMVELRDGVNYEGDYNTYNVRGARLDENGKIIEFIDNLEIWFGMTDADGYREVEFHVPGGYLGGYNFYDGATINKYKQIKKEYEKVANIRTLEGIDPKFKPYFENKKMEIDDCFATYDEYIALDKTAENHRRLENNLSFLNHIVNNIYLVYDLNDAAKQAKKEANDFKISALCPALDPVSEAIIQKCDQMISNFENYYVGETEQDIMKCKEFNKIINYIYEKIGAVLNEKVGNNPHFMEDDFEFDMYMASDFFYDIMFEGSYQSVGDRVIEFYNRKLQNM